MTSLEVLDERVKNMIQQNEEAHKVILATLKEDRRCIDEEIKAINMKVQKNTMSIMESQVSWRVLAKIGATALTVSGFIITLIKLILGV